MTVQAPHPPSLHPSLVPVKPTEYLLRSTQDCLRADVSYFLLLHTEKGRLRIAVANRVPASRWQGILFRINFK